MSDMQIKCLRVYKKFGTNWIGLEGELVLNIGDVNDLLDDGYLEWKNRNRNRCGYYRLAPKALSLIKEFNETKT